MLSCCHRRLFRLLGAFPAVRHRLSNSFRAAQSSAQTQGPLRTLPTLPWTCEAANAPRIPRRHLCALFSARYMSSKHTPSGDARELEWQRRKVITHEQLATLLGSSAIEKTSSAQHSTSAGGILLHSVHKDAPPPSGRSMGDKHDGGEDVVQQQANTEGPASFLLLDVRETHEVLQRGSIPHAINVPLPLLFSVDLDDVEDFEQIARVDLADTVSKESTPVIIYCEHGIRSTVAQSLFEEAGWRHCYNYVGSFSEWEQQTPACSTR